ncbi:MAG TPA: hypothetical protein VL989_00375 [Candidatus Sulfotelmatobacter sp.]|nr:hypothetical protein [Candidatus Sulfotelmatobacter sp.]
MSANDIESELHLAGADVAPEQAAAFLLRRVAARNEGIITSEELEHIALLIGDKALEDSIMDLGADGEAEIDFDEQYDITGVRFVSEVGRAALLRATAPQDNTNAKQPASLADTAPELNRNPLQEVSAEPVLEGVTARAAIINYLKSIPGNTLERGNEKSVGPVLARVLAEHGHSPNSVALALTRLVKQGLVLQTKRTPKAKMMESIRLSEDAKNSPTTGQFKDRALTPKDAPNFFYRDSDGHRIYVDISETEFRGMSPTDRFLVTAARFHNVRFMGLSAYESLLRAIHLSKDESANDIISEGLIAIGEHTVALSEAGETRLRQLCESNREKEDSREDNLIPSSRIEAPDYGQTVALEAEREGDAKEIPKSTILKRSFIQLLRDRGAGITATETDSVNQQLRDICINELGGTEKDYERLYMALRNAPEILRLSFRNGEKSVVRYLGLSELQDDPLTRGLIMTADLRNMIEEYVSSSRLRRLSIDPEVLSYRELSERMMQTDWADLPFEDLEQYMSDVLKALRSVAQRNRLLRQTMPRGY